MPTPSTRAALLAEGISSCKLLLGRYLVGFNEVTHVRQTPDLPNHLSWCLGHCALTMLRVADKIDGRGLPASDFVQPPIADGFKGSRDKGVFDSEAVAFGSKPEERHDRYPSLPRSTEIYNNACDRLATALLTIDDAKLDQPIPWGQAGQTMPLSMLVIRMVFHNGFHTGQIADLRRALGFKSIFG